METGLSSADNTDYEGDTFEDAQDSANEPNPPRPTSSTRSLTSPPATSSSSEAATPKAAPPASPDKEEEDAAYQNEQVNGDNAAKSPLLTAHRMSTDMDDVNLSPSRDEERDEETPEHKSPSPVEDKSERVAAPSKPPPLPSRFTGFSAALPSVPWGPPPAKSATSPALPTPQPQSRKLVSPFAWLGRGPSLSKESKSPPLPPSGGLSDRRNTAASISTLGSNPELMLRALEDGNDSDSVGSGSRRPARSSLRERFKLLRMREEAGVLSLDDPTKIEGGAIAGLIGRSSSLGLGIGSPGSLAEDKEGGFPLGSPITVTSPASVLPIPTPTTSINPNLAPGTVSGAASSPGDAATPIDWDFWQSVVTEGPALVAKTSPEELTLAIASGIPQTIRGVIWQVMADSKNEDLEGVYRDLLVKGTDTEKERASTLSVTTNGLTNGNLREKESIASSASSIHSTQSMATGSNIGVTSPSPSYEKDAESMAYLQTALIAERKKKTKEDAAALQKLERMIKRDMGTRTSYSKYVVAAGFQDSLFNVCKAYALFDEGVGYPQGMNFVIMPLLFTMEEEEAFCLLVRLMNKYRLRELFINDMPGLHLHLYQYERLLEDLEPALYCHLNRRGVSPKLYATQWFLTLFAYRFPLQLVLRVYDLILSEGLEGAILKFGMAVVQRNAATLLGMNDMLALTNFLKEKIFDVYIDKTPSAKSILESGFFGNSGGSDTEVYRADILVQDACAVQLTSDMLTKYRVEWEEKVRQDKEREVELETYRTMIASHTTKIRSLEERAEKSDTEHVQIASELVRTKVENQELLDRNESLRGRVDELKNVVDAQPAELEDKLRMEMDRIMQRNAEVQGENRTMEEQVAEMEKALVETKMKYAEINENYETLKQKWQDLRKALD